MFPPETIGVPKVGALQGAGVVVVVVVGAAVVVVVVVQPPLLITTPTELICTIRLYPKDGTYKLYHKFPPLNGIVKPTLV